VADERPGTPPPHRSGPGRGGDGDDLSRVQEHHHLGHFHVGLPRAHPPPAPLRDLRPAIFDRGVLDPQPFTPRAAHRRRA